MKRLFAILLTSATLLVFRTEAAEPAADRAYQAPLAAHAPLVTAIQAGQRIVAAGDYGIILLSDDRGQTWRQAKDVPTTTMITDLSFADGSHGWATAHGGLLLATEDGGETWRVAQRAAPDVVPMSIAFDRKGTGIMVGTYGYAMRTEDGGRSWAPFTLEGGDIPDRHLNHVFSTGDGSFVIVGEVGAVYRSDDGGHSWDFQELPIKGSLWYGTALRSGGVLISGMGGRLLRSEDGRQGWTPLDAATDQSLTGIAELADGRVVVVGLGGTVSVGAADGSGFAIVPRPDRGTYAAVLPIDNDAVLLFGGAGVTSARLAK